MTISKIIALTLSLAAFIAVLGMGIGISNQDTPVLEASDHTPTPYGTVSRADVVGQTVDNPLSAGGKVSITQALVTDATRQSEWQYRESNLNAFYQVRARVAEVLKSNSNSFTCGSRGNEAPVVNLWWVGEASDSESRIGFYRRCPSS